MITLEAIGQSHGYSGYDHLLNDGPLQDLVGQSFRSVADLRRRANKVQDSSLDRRCAPPPIWCRIRHASGSPAEVTV